MPVDIVPTVLAALLLAACSSSEGDTEGANHSASAAETSGATGDDAIGGNVDEVCQAYADHFAECTGASAYEVTQAQGDCGAELGGGAPAGASCRSATEAFYACLTGLVCASFDASSGCPAERDAMGVACQGLGDGSTTEG